MSATGRGTTRDLRDFYATPRDAFAPLLSILPRDVRFWEPCAGDGRLIRMLRETGRMAAGSDLYPQAEASGLYPTASLDYLKDEMPYEFVLTNPPFGVAFEMCQHARTHSHEFMFLLRLSFLESEERGDWLSANEPSALFVLKKRPSFVMACRCKKKDIDVGLVRTTIGCGHSWLLPIESARPKVCPKCGETRTVEISTSDNSGYAWFYWSQDEKPRFTGIHHI